MANPTHRHTRTRRDKRRANWKGQMPVLGVCPECKELKEPHRVCLSCGSYNGRKVLQILEKE
ncbi:MAG: 50S ribosomal protein L32 [Thermodesulfovibrionales bacterium]|jgi:large subunit ribosomal protein L32